MLILKIAVRSLLRRKSRAATIGALVAFGTLLLVLGQTFARSAGIASRDSIIDNFTGDLILYSERSKEKPSPFAFNTPLPVIKDVERIRQYVQGLPGVEAVVPFAQNYAVIQVQKNGKPVELPFIFYAIEPASYRRIFRNAEMRQGSFFGVEDGKPAQGILISEHQNDQYQKNYGVSLKSGEAVTVLGLTEGGSVNALRSRLVGLFEPRYFKNVFNYINFMDIASYSSLYSFTGVAADSLPDSLNRGLQEASGNDEAAIFGLAADSSFGKLNLDRLRSETLSGYTMIAVRLADHRDVDRVISTVDAAGLGVKAARWDEASGFFARIASGLQAFIILATALIFLIVAFIFMNTLIINIVERTSEIGTMRALGGEKSFIRRLFLAETLLLNIPFSLGAMALSLAAVLATGVAGVAGPGGLPLPDSISQYLIGGGALPLRLAAAPFLEALAIVGAVSVLATLYPIRVATAITPLAAMSER
jgi:ABC-type lipoprotein release transport system permease subunit